MATSSAGFEIFDILWPRLPVGVGRPFLGTAGHIASVTHPEQERSLGAGPPFVQLAGWMDDEHAGLYRDSLVRRLHHAAALKAEIDFSGLGVAVIGAGLP